MPLASTLPPAAPSCTDQDTPLDWPLRMPVTVALKLTVPSARVDALLGATVTEMPWSAVTVTDAVAFFDGLATLAATTWNVPGFPGAV